MKKFEKEITYIRFIMYCSLSFIGSIFIDIFKQKTIMNILDRFIYFIPDIILITCIYYFFNGRSFKPIRQDKGIIILLINLVIIVSLSAVFIAFFG